MWRKNSVQFPVSLADTIVCGDGERTSVPSGSQGLAIKGALSKSLRSQGLEFEEKSFSGDYAVSSDVTGLVVFGLSVRQ